MTRTEAIPVILGELAWAVDPDHCGYDVVCSSVWVCHDEISLVLWRMSVVGISGSHPRSM
jgi:hypothetical protein